MCPASRTHVQTSHFRPVCIYTARLQVPHGPWTVRLACNCFACPLQCFCLRQMVLQLSHGRSLFFICLTYVFVYVHLNLIVTCALPFSYVCIHVFVYVRVHSVVTCAPPFSICLYVCICICARAFSCLSHVCMYVFVYVRVHFVVKCALSFLICLHVSICIRTCTFSCDMCASVLHVCMSTFVQFQVHLLVKCAFPTFICLHIAVAKLFVALHLQPNSLTNFPIQNQTPLDKLFVAWHPLPHTLANLPTQNQTPVDKFSCVCIRCRTLTPTFQLKIRSH
jgi:hypothetical protein